MYKVFNLNDKDTWSDNVKRLVHYYKFEGLFDDDFTNDFFTGKIKLDLTKTEVEQVCYILANLSNDLINSNDQAIGIFNNLYTDYKSYDQIVADHYERLVEKYSFK